MTPAQLTLIQLLADGRFHSGIELGAILGVTRSAVWKALKPLTDYGLEIQAVSGRGYRLARPLELLNKESIARAVASVTSHRLGRIEVLPVTDSTNAHLLRRSAQELPDVCLAEYQQAGRGRRGRRWESPFGANLYLSLRWRFVEGMGRLGGLSLACAVAARRALSNAGVDGIELKWPNDILWQGRKLGGILLEATGETAGPCQVVVGIGLNVNMPDVAAEAIDQPWVDLTAVHSGIARNWMAGLLVGHMVDVMAEFTQHGLAPFLTEWRANDATAGREVILLLPDEVVRGEGCGVADDGALLLRRGRRIERYGYGEVSLRVVGTPE